MGAGLDDAILSCESDLCSAECDPDPGDPDPGADGCGLADLPYLTGNNKCGDCYHASCCDEGIACSNSPECSAAASCALACVAQNADCPPGGLDVCKGMPGWADWESLVQCGNDSCAVECSTGCGFAELPDLAGKPPACGSCFKANCCEEGVYCAQSAECSAAANCALACVAQNADCPPGGIGACQQMPGWDDWVSFVECGQDNCEAECK